MIVSFYSFHASTRVIGINDQLQVYHIKESNSNDALAQSSDSVILSLYENARLIKLTCIPDYIIDPIRHAITNQKHTIPIFKSNFKGPGKPKYRLHSPHADLIRHLQYEAIANPWMYSAHFDLSHHCCNV